MMRHFPADFDNVLPRPSDSLLQDLDFDHVIYVVRCFFSKHHQLDLNVTLGLYFLGLNVVVFNKIVGAGTLKLHSN